ncbi:15505_t:CDS:2, partial [Funneliformis geosporum]
WDPSKPYTGWDFITHFGKDTWNKQAKNGLFDTFSKSDAYEVLEHNALLDVLADPVKGLKLNEY